MNDPVIIAKTKFITYLSIFIDSQIFEIILC